MDKFMMSTSAEQLTITIVDVITANMSPDSTYKSHDSASNSSVVAILGAVGALVTVAIIAVITFVLITRLRLKVNTQVMDNIAAYEIPHDTINAWVC